jgi:hypothetical protein
MMEATMKINRHMISRIVSIVLLFPSLSIVVSGHGLIQDDPVQAPNIPSLPVIDGMGSDTCWQNVPWQSIDQVWIEYGEEIPVEDFTGHYKVVWSSSQNLLYFLIEVSDDVLVDGYTYGQTAEVHHFDIVEVFIDENQSGGLHVFDGTGYTGQQWGTNAENAFAYHIYADFPDEGEATTNFRVNDLDGTGWNNAITRNYASHFPEFALRKNENQLVWEFSLIVYDDTYENDNVNPARVQLEVDKEMGLSLAYCDNDDPNEVPKQRDHFFGSVWVPAEAYNDHWMNADYFGTVKLVSEIQSFINVNNKIQYNSLNLYPNPASSCFQLDMNNAFKGDVSMRIYNLLGQEVFYAQAMKTNQRFNQSFSLQHFPKGIYFVKTQIAGEVFHQKLILTQ